MTVKAVSLVVLLAELMLLLMPLLVEERLAELEEEELLLLLVVLAEAAMLSPELELVDRLELKLESSWHVGVWLSSEDLGEDCVDEKH